MLSIEQKIEQMYKALEEMQITEKLSSVKPEIKMHGWKCFFLVRLQEGSRHINGSE